jgi:DNA-binding beta-propeller fold protein YncE
VLNRTTKANADGTWLLPTVPANFGPVRARATCVRNGVTFFGQSDLFTIGANQSVTLQPIILGNVSPVPASISVTAPTTTLTQAGQTTQLMAAATYTGGGTQNISAASTGTVYQVSNPTIATVSADGLVTAVSSGTVLIQAHNEGAQGIVNIQVAIGGASNGGIPNSWILANFCPNFVQGIPCLQLTDPSFPSEDPDHDGLTNLQEFQLGTDPNNPDTDGDGLTDGQEVLIYHTNPLLFSTDGSGIPDGIEVQTGTLGGTFAVKLAAALQSLSVKPSTFLLAVNSLSQQASQQLAVTGLLIDSKTTLDLTSTQKGTNYSSSDLTICNFGAPDGNVFAGNVGACMITVTNSGFTATASGTVTGFSPTALGSVSIPGFANEVAVNGNYAFVAAGSAGLQVVDVTNRSNPVVVASLSLPGNANSVRVVGNLAFVAAGSAGLQIIDITSPRAPALRGTLSTSGNALDVNVQGNVAYVANGSGLFLASVANPSVPTALSSLPLAGLIQGVSVDPQRGVAAVAAYTSGIYVVDVSNLGAPVVRSQLPTGGAHQVAIKGNFAFVADFETSYQDSLVSVDISNPSAPKVVSSITNKSLGGLLNDLVISGNLALGATGNFSIAGIPITDISDPTNLHSRTILFFPPQAAQGMGLAVDGTYVYQATDSTVFEKKFGTTGNSRLVIGQYQVLQDTFGIPPTAAIVSPVAGSTVVQGATIQVTVNATDDVAVAAVNLFANGQPVLTDTVAPYVFYYTVPMGITTLTLGATAVDYGGNVGTASNVALSVIPDLGTTVIGRVVDGNSNPLAGFIAQTIGHSAITASDGTFSISGVPTVSVSTNGITVETHGVAGGFVRAGTSATVAPVIGGTTNVGDIVTAARPLIVVDSNEGAVSALDTSVFPPTVIQTAGAFGASPAGVSVTPDGSKALVTVANGFGTPIRVFDLTTNPPSFIADISFNTIFGISTPIMNAVTSDGRFAVATVNASKLASIDVASRTILSTLNLPFGAALAITPDNTTVIVGDNSNNVFRIFALSPQGLLTDTGKTVPYNFLGFAGNITMAPNGRFALFANRSANNVAILRIDASHNVTIGGTIPMCCQPAGVAFTLDASKAYVANGQSGDVAVLSIDATDTITDTTIRVAIPNGINSGGPGVPAIAIAVDGKAYISNTIQNPDHSTGTVTILDTNTNTVLGTVNVPLFPTGIGVPR